MLARPYRLRQAADITRVYKRGNYGSAKGLLSVKAITNGRPEARVAIVVSKKVDKRATVRNRIRRRISGEFERHWATVRPGYDIVVSVHSDLSALAAADLAAHLTQALTKAGVSAS